MCALCAENYINGASLRRAMKSAHSYDEHPLQTDEFTVSHGPEGFLIDCRMITQQFELQGGPPTLNVAHRTLRVTPMLAKELHRVLGVQVKRYEETFGKITKSGAQKKAEKLAKNAQSSADKPHYMG